MSELEFLEHYNKKIQKHGDNPDVLLRSLGKLDQVRVTIDLLAQTGVGKTVSALKKRYGDSEIGTLSRDLVAKWKASVAIEEEERENEESEEVAENGNDDPKPSPEYSVPEYVPTRISTEVARKSSEDENNQEKGDNSEDEDKYSRKSKKKKSHRERSEEGESHRSDKSHKHKKDKEREKEKKHKHSEREKEKESRTSSSSRDKDKEQKRKSSHRDRHREDDVKTKEIKKEKKCDIKEESDQGDRNKRRNDDAHHGIHDNQRELKHVSKSEVKHSRSKHHDLSSFDMFSKPSLEFNEEKASSRKRKGDAIEDSSSSKHPKLLGSSHKNNLPSLPSSFSGTNLIPDISPIYKPLPRTNPFLAENKKTEGKNDIDLSVLLSSKNKGMSRIYSGVKRTGFLGGEVPSLFSQCIQVLKENVDYIEEVGGLPYDIMKPVLLMASDTTLMRIEDCNPHLMEFTGELWDKLVKKHFFNKKPEEMESPREMYERCTRERAAKFEKLKGKMKETVKEEEDSHRQTKLAYVDIAPKAPRQIRNQQAKHGTALPSGTPLVPGAPRPRNQILDPTAGASRAYVAPKKPKTAPLMAKTFKLMRGIKGGFRR